MNPEIERHRLLGTYLNDHVAGATAGTRLAQRLAIAHRSSPDAQALYGLAKEVRDDRGTLIAIMAALNVPVHRVKVLAGWSAELLGRLKPNNHLFTRSPLSTLTELEVMRLGVEGKKAGWLTLRTVADRDGRLDPDHLDRLIDRADRQAQLLEDLRARSIRAVFADPDV